MREHNERDFGAHHKKPYYILPNEHHLKNESFKWLSVEDVTKEYLATTKWGREHGKIHHKAKPFREAIVHFEREHTIEDMKRLSARLEDELSIQVMYCHMHKDEGHIDEFGKPQFNFHAHLGFTNLKNGKLHHFDNVKCAKAQDICSEVLGMERGVRNSNAVGVDHKSYRRMMKEKDALSKDLTIEIEKASSNGFDHWTESERLASENSELQAEVHGLSRKIRELLKSNSELAARLDEEKTKAAQYQAVKKAKDTEDIHSLEIQLSKALQRNEVLQAKLEASESKNHFTHDDEIFSNLINSEPKPQPNSAFSKLLVKLNMSRIPKSFDDFARRALTYIEDLEAKLSRSLAVEANEKAGLSPRKKR